MQDLRQIQETKLAVSPGLECSIVLVGLDLSSAQDYQQKGQISGAATGAGVFALR